MISLLAVKLLSLCSGGELDCQEQSCGAEPSPGERQLFCRSCRCSFLTRLENNKFSIKPSIFQQALSSVPGGIRLQLHCAVTQGRKQKTARPKGSAGGIQGDRKQLNSLEFAQALGVVTPSPT